MVQVSGSSQIWLALCARAYGITTEWLPPKDCSVNNEQYEYVLGLSTKTAQLAASRLSFRWTGVAQARFERFVGVQSS